ncbi:FHA domain-containing protein (plasmid) [Bradyrhizobium sp. Pa8]|uniref:FHA domain-containing protein n=1 Tax=Bradyrhizobium sp. Pa8 TaxID=3386552 RepID=UPI00403F6B35
MRNAKREQDILTDDQTKFALRVLSGPNRGAETSLDEGVWLIGSHETDDLTFADPELVGSHLRIVIEQTRIQVTALAPGVLIGGRHCVADNSTVLDPFTPVEVGRTIFSIGPVGCSFPDADSVVERKRRNAKRLPSASKRPLALDGRETGLAIASIRRRFWLGVVACGLLLIMYGTWMGIARISSFTTGAVLGTEQIKIAKGILRDLTARDVSITSADKKLVIDGDLRPREDTKPGIPPRDVGQGAAVISKQPSPTTLPDAKLVDLAATVIRGLDIEGNIHVGGAGEISVTGYASSNAKVEAALRRLQQDIPGLRKVDDAIVTPERARAFLETATTSELRRSIRISTTPDAVIVSGTLTPPTLNEWQSVASRFEERFAPRIRLEMHCSLMVLPTARGVHLGGTPFIVLQNGTRLRVGDNIDHIGRIVVIDREGMLVRIGESEVRILYASKPGWIEEEDQG